MRWIVLQKNRIFSGNVAQLLTTVDFNWDVSSTFTRIAYRMMFQFQELITDHSKVALTIPANPQLIGFRRTLSDQNIASSSFHCLNSWWMQPHFLCDTRYSSTELNDPSDNSVFSTFLGPNSPHLLKIPMPPPKTQEFLSPQNFHNAQKRYYLRQTASNSSNNIRQDLDEVSEVLKVLSKRYWQETEHAKKASKKKPSTSRFQFTLMSYNVLAQNLLVDHPYLYKHHNQKALMWEQRWKNLFNEIKTMKPDILCLQEVQESHLMNYYRQLETLGYQGLYKKRTGKCCDGCAIYYKPAILNLVEYETVEFNQPNISVLNRDNIAIIAKFSPRNNPEKHFIVATTHLLYNPKREDVRLAQTQLLLTEVERLSFYWNSKGKRKYWPIIITGDFNSSPGSAIHQLITKGCLKYDHLAERRMHRVESPRHGNVLVPSDLQITDSCQHASLIEKREKKENLSRGDEAALIKLHNSNKAVMKISSELIQKPNLFSSGTLTHLFALKSVYDHGNPDNPEGTTFQNEWLTVDYIFYSGKKRDDKIEDHKLKLLASYRLPLREELGTMRIPNKLIGSDHLSLVAKFKMNI